MEGLCEDSDRVRAGDGRAGREGGANKGGERGKREEGGGKVRQRQQRHRHPHQQQQKGRACEETRKAQRTQALPHGERAASGCIPVGEQEAARAPHVRACPPTRGPSPRRLAGDYV
ncbi:hypothetical protein BM1_03080 [Bipolaris maydis]|nr:hypothetical protein BM1_03080 [Bipolaris maydis]